METKQLLKQNLELVAGREPRVVARFYERLFAANPELRSLFTTRSLDAQERVLLQALVSLVTRLDEAQWVEATLRGLGERHARYGVTDAMYPLVASALLTTLAEISGPEWDEATSAAWTAVLGHVATTMIAAGRSVAAA